MMTIVISGGRMTPLTLDEIREWAVVRLEDNPTTDSECGYNEAIESLIIYIDNEPKLRELFQEKENQ